MQVADGKIVAVAEGNLATPCNSALTRKQRQLSASLGLISVDRDRAHRGTEEDEGWDEAQYFPMASLDINLGREYMDSHPMLRAVYRIVDKESFLDWGLSSDYQMSEVTARNGRVGMGV